MLILVVVILLWTIQIALIVNYIYLWVPLIFRVLLYRRIKNMVRQDTRLPGRQKTDFTVLVPAHNEAGVLGNLFQSLRLQTYPAELLHIYVVSDNSTDDTTTLTRQNDFACYKRTTTGGSTKGQALTWLWHQLLAEKAVAQNSIVVIIDADCIVSVDYFDQLDRAYEAGAEVLQSFRSSGQLGHSFVTNLEAASEELRQQLGGLVRRSLNLSTFLCGSGMAFRRDIFQALIDFTEKDETITEDMHWQLFLAKNQVKITFWPSSKVVVEAIANMKEFSKQRRRWVGDRMRGIFKNGLPLLLSGIRHTSLSQIDQGLYFMQLPRSFLIALSLLFTALAALWPATSPLAWWVWLIFYSQFRLVFDSRLCTAQSASKSLLEPCNVTGYRYQNCHNQRINHPWTDSASVGGGQTRVAEIGQYLFQKGIAPL